MRAKHLRIACVLICIILLLCGCKEEQGEKHNIADIWQFNQDTHWHVCDSADCDEYHDVAEHQWDSGVIKQETSCDTVGEMVFSCTVCHATKTVTNACAEHTSAGEWKYDNNSHWYLCEGCGRDYSQAAHKWYVATTSETGEVTEELYVCIICNLITDEKPAVLEDPNAKPIYVGKIPSNIPTLGNGEYVFIPHMNGNNFTVESANSANISKKRGEKTPFGKSVIIEVPVGAGLLTIKPDSIMNKEDVEKFVAEGYSEIVASFSVEITGGMWWGGPVTVSTPWSGMSYSTDKYTENKASLTVKFSAADLLANYDRVCEEGLFIFDYANYNWDSYSFTLTPFEITESHELGAQWEQDEADHYHVCKVCGVEKDRAAHTITGNVCSVCGEVKRYLFKPKTDGSNFVVSNSGNVPINVYRGETELGSVAVIDVPQNADVITFTPKEIMDKARLEQLLADGCTEVQAQLTMRITGGMWWGGSARVTASWTGMSYLYPESKFVNNLLGPVTIKFAVQDVLNNYDRICTEGLFSFYFDNQAHDTYQISFSGFELTANHEWLDEWQQDEMFHYHSCSICGAETDKAKHEMAEANVCSVCGEVRRYFFKPEADGSNFAAINISTAANLTVSRGETELGNTAVIDVPLNTYAVRIQPDTIMDKERLEQLQAEGCTEVRTQLIMRITGGMWWGGPASITTTWSDRGYSYPESDFKNNLLGPVTLKFAVQDLLDNYDKISTEGLFTFQFSNWQHDTYQISFTGFELVADHEWTGDWERDETYHYHFCTICERKVDVEEHDWIDAATCSVCGTETSLNDFYDKTGIQVAYTNPANGTEKSTFENSRIGRDGDYLKIYIPMWMKSNSPRFYMPLKLTKLQVKALLDIGCTEFTVDFKQGTMVQQPVWDLTNVISAAWTDATYTVKTKDGVQTLRFSLQDLYDHYDAINSGDMALLNFKVSELSTAEGGIWIDGYGWMSTDYYIWIGNIEVDDTCKHLQTTPWSNDENNHWHSCIRCGEVVDTAPHGFEKWTEGTDGHYQACSTCGYQTASSAHTISDLWSHDETNHWHGCTLCGYKQDVTAHQWVEVPGGKKCSVCGYENVLYFVLNDFVETNGIRMTFENVSGSQAESTFVNGQISRDADALKIRIPTYTKPRTLRFYAPLQISKENVKKLLSAGCTEFTVTIQQGLMNQAPQSSLTNTVGADWTSTIYTVTYADGFKILTFSLQDLYDNYDAIANGSMALFNFSIAELGVSHGGIIVPGQGMVPVDYDIWIKNLEVVPADT